MAGRGSQQPVDEALDQTQAAVDQQEQQEQVGGGGAAAAAGGPAAGGPPGDEPDEEWASQDEEEEGWHDAVQDDDDGDWLVEVEDEEDVDDEDDMEWEVEGEWDDEDEADGVFTSESSDEPAAAEAATQRLAEETAGRHVEPGWASYAVHTACHHFQSADALAVTDDPRGSGALLAAALDQHGLSLWLLPGAGDVARLGPSEPQARRLGGFQVPREAYALAWAAGGSYLATGGEGGLLSLYSVHPEAAARPLLPEGRIPSLEGLNFFYTPLLMPAQLRRLQQHLRGQVEGGGGTGTAVAAPQEVQGEQQQPRGELQQPGDEQAQQQARHLQAGEDAKAMRGFLRAVLNQDLAHVSRQPGQDVSEEEMQAALVRAGAAVHRLTTAMAAGQSVDRVAAAVAGELQPVWPSPLPQQPQQQVQQQAQQQAPPPPQPQQADAGEQGAGDGDGEYEAAQQRLLSSWQRFSTTVAGPQAAEGERAAAAAGQKKQQGPQPQPPQPQPPQQQAEGKGKQPAEALAGFLLGEGSGQQRRQQRQGGELADGRAALMLRATFALGFPDAAQARGRRYVHDGMTNGVRCGIVAGRERLLAADQSGYVYLFESPAHLLSDSAGSSAGSSAAGPASVDSLRAQRLLCAGLGEASPHWRMRPVNVFEAQQHALGASLSQATPPPAARPGQRSGTRAAARAAAAGSTEACVAHEVFQTAALGPFPVPINLAVPSPDGRWVAVVGDSQAVFLADQAARFAWRQLAFDLGGSRDPVEQGLEAGSQYAAWNATSSLLAVSSDALHAVFVFQPASGQLVLRVEGHAKPCLSIGFAPWHDHLLVYAEEAKHVHLRRVPVAQPGAACCEQNAHDELGDAPAGVQLLRLPILAAGPPPPAPGVPPLLGNRRRRVNGLALSAQGDVLVATRQSAVLRFLAAQPWEPERNACWPPSFRATVRTLLLAAHRQAAVAAQRPDAPAGLWVLPLPLLQRIIELAAGRRTDWLPRAEASSAPAAGAGGGG